MFKKTCIICGNKKLFNIFKNKGKFKCEDCLKNKTNIIEGKICTGCGNFKVLDDFYKAKNGKFGRRSKCKDCKKEYYKDPENKQRIKEQQKEYYKDPEVKKRKKEYYTKYYKDPKNKQRIKEQQKEYYKDPNVKQRIKEYHVGYHANYYKNSVNKQRIKEYHAKYYKDPNVKQRRKDYNKKYYAKYCNRPDVKQRKKEYYKDSVIKQRIKEYHAEYYKNPNVKQKRKEYQKEYNKNLVNRQRIKEQQKEYQKEYNKNLVNRQRLKEYLKDKYKDPLVKLRLTISHYIYKGLKTVNLNKTPKGSMLYINYTMIQLKQHIESQFEDWMTWKNHGVIQEGNWQLDHIIPQTSYDWTDENEIKKCWDLRNLRPLCSIENSSKHNTINLLLIKEYQIEDLLPKPTKT